MKRVFPDNALKNILKFINFKEVPEDINLNAVEVILYNYNFRNNKYREIIHDFVYNGFSYERLSKKHMRSEERIKEILKLNLSKFLWEESIEFINFGVDDNFYVSDYRLYKMCINRGLTVFMSEKDRRKIRLSYINIPVTSVFIPGKLTINRLGELEDLISQNGKDWWKLVPGMQDYFAEVIEETIKKVPTGYKGVNNEFC